MIDTVAVDVLPGGSPLKTVRLSYGVVVRETVVPSSLYIKGHKVPS